MWLSNLLNILLKILEPLGHQMAILQHSWDKRQVAQKCDKNPYCWDGNSWKDAMGEEGIDVFAFKYQANTVPFEFKYGDDEYEVKHDMFFLGGLVGVSVDSVDHALTPTFGYAVTQQT